MATSDEPTEPQPCLRRCGFFGAPWPDTLTLMPDLAKQYLRNPNAPLSTVRCSPWNLGGAVLQLIGQLVSTEHAAGSELAAAASATDRVLRAPGERRPVPVAFHPPPPPRSRRLRAMAARFCAPEAARRREAAVPRVSSAERARCDLARALRRYESSVSTNQFGPNARLGARPSDTGGHGAGQGAWVLLFFLAWELELLPVYL